MPRSFAHLHAHTDFSLLDGAARIGPLIAEAARLGMPAIAMTDHGNMFGAYSFWRKAVAAGIKPVLGIEAYVAPASRQHRKAVYWGQEQRKSDRDVSGGGAYTHMTLLAADPEGLRNLFQLQSRGWLEGFWNKWPRVDTDLLAQYSSGVIATTGCLGGEIPTRLRLGQYDKALEAAGRYQDIYGKDSYYLELMDHGIEDERVLRGDLLRLGRQLGLPPLVTNDLHYVTGDQAPAHDALLCISTGKKIADTDRFRFSGDGYYVKPAAEMRAYWDDLIPGGCDNTLLVAERVSAYDEVFAHRDLMPVFPVPDGQTEESLLRAMTAEGARRRYGSHVPAERIEYELSVIIQMGFSGYMLVVADICQYARDNGIEVGPGRGSAAGSVVAYTLGITDLDPLQHGLLFERFLNPERVSMPDIDLDFEDRRRPELFDYVTRKYGQDRVCQIITYGVIKAKTAVKDSARILGLPYAVGEKIVKAFPSAIGGNEVPLDAISDPGHQRYGHCSALRGLYNDDPDAKTVIDKAREVEGLTREFGVHAAGVVISREPVISIVPLYCAKGEGRPAAGFTMFDVEDMGLLKMDFLGVRNLTVIADTVRAVKATRGIDIDIAGLPLDDPATYKMLAAGDTCGIFQFESDGICNLLQAMQPTRFDDISAAQALYRPGPMEAGAHTAYALRKTGKQPVTPIHPELADALGPVLGDTYGLIVYQEQVMQAAQVLAGYTLGQADLLRRAMGKKKKEILDKEYVPFRDGMLTNGYSEDAIRTVWDILVPFAGYAFNRSHSAAYGLISYRTAYLKANFPAEYMAALLTSVGDDKDKPALYLAECRRMGIKVLPPDVNESAAMFAAAGTDVRFGMAAVRNVGVNVVDAIISARTAKGTFTSFSDFLDKIPAAACNKRVIDSLIKAGAFDSLGEPRKGLTLMYDQAVDAVISLKRNEAIGQESLFGEGTEASAVFNVPVPAGEWDKMTRLGYEREMLGLYVSAHPLDGLDQVLAGHRDMTIAELRTGNPGGSVSIAGLITGVEQKTAKKDGSPWAAVTLEDLDASIEVCFFSRAWAKHSQSLTPDRVVSISGRLSDRGKLSLTADTMTILDVAAGTKPAVIAMTLAQAQPAIIRDLKRALLAHPGSTPVHLKVDPADGSRKILTHLAGFTVSPVPGFWADIKAILGPGAALRNSHGTAHGS